MRAARIAGLGTFLPDGVVTNADLAARLSTSDDWIFQRTGIRERRWAPDGTGASDLALPAARQALAEAGLEVGDLDLIVFATLSPDLFFPGSGCLLQASLGAGGVPAIDVRNQCSGLLHGLAIADHFVRTGFCDHVLVAGAEVHSGGLDLSDRGRDVTVLFGDGGGALVVSPSDGERRLIDHTLGADGTKADVLKIEAPTSRRNPRITHEMLDAGLHFPRMDGRAVFREAVERLPELVVSLLARNGYTLDDMALLVPHQANRRINEAVARRLGLPEERVVHAIERVGNTTAASIPIALGQARAEGRLREGDLVVMAALGAGLTWAASLVRW